MEDDRARKWVDWLIPFIQQTRTRQELDDLRNNKAVAESIARLPEAYAIEAKSAFAEQHERLGRFRREEAVA